MKRALRPGAIVMAVLSLALMAACAAEGRGGAPAKSAPAPGGPAVQEDADQLRSERPTSVQPQGAPAPQPVPPMPPGARSPAEELREAEVELASAGDCALACRALRSMERAATHLCGVAATDEDRRACDDAKRRVVTAQDRVAKTCGGCGP